MRRLALLLACAGVSVGVSACADSAPDSANENASLSAISGPMSNLTASADPRPASSDRLFLDTRVSLQSVTSTQQATALFNGGTTGRLSFATNFDGRGTRALVLPWAKANGCDHSDGKLILQQLPEPRPKQLYVQWKSWLGRTESGGGVGAVGAFDVTRASCPSSGMDRVRVLRDVPGFDASGAVKLEWYGAEPGLQRVVREPRTGADMPEYGYEQPGSELFPEQRINSAITTTVFLKASSSPDAADGVVMVWQNGVQRIHRTDLRLGAAAFDRVQLPEIMRGADVQMTEYLWDVVMWQPEAASTSGAPIAPVAALRIQPRDMVLTTGTTAQVSATPLDALGNALTGRTVNWRSVNPTIASITAAGVITAVAAGATWMIATADGVTDSARVTVQQLTSSTTTGGTTGSTTGTTTGSTTGATTGTSTVAFGTLLRDDFTRYGSTVDLKAQFGWGKLYSFANVPELISLDGAVRYNGHATMRYDQPGGTRTTPSLMPYLPRAVESFWYRAKIRYSPGWSTTGVEGTGAEAYKIFGWGWKGYEERGGFDYTNGNDYYLYWGVKPEGSTAMDVFPSQEGIGIRDTFAGKANVSPNAEWSDGGWYDLIIHWKRYSSTRGQATVWLAKDGSLPVLRGTVGGTLLQGEVPLVEYLMLGMNFNRVRYPTQAQSIWYGQWEVIDGGQNANPFGLTLP